MNLDGVQLDEIHSRVDRAASLGRTFAITEDRSVGFADVARAAQVFCSGLASSGLMQQKRLALASDLGAREIAALWLAALRLGLTCLFVATPRSPREAETFCRDNQVDLICLPNGLDGVTAYSPKGVETLTLGGNTTLAVSDDPAAATVFFTSGSTGKAKGVHLGCHGIARHLELYTRLFNYDRADAVIMNGLPLHHTDGSFHGPMMALWSGATWLQPPRFTIQTAGQWAKLARQHRVSHLIANPTLLDMLLLAFSDGKAIDFGPLATIVSSAEVLTPAVWQQVESRFRADVVNIYGMSETTNGGFFALPTDRPKTFGTVGRAHDISFEIRDEAGKPLSAGLPGRLFLKGKSLFQGYEQGGVTIYRRTPEDWFDTADQAVLDSNGNLSILGRLDGQINLAGYLTSPATIADALTNLGVFAQVRVEILEEAPGRQVPVAFIPDSSPQDVLGLINELHVEHRPRHILRVPEMAANQLSLSDCIKLFARYRAAQEGAIAQSGSVDIRHTVFTLAARAFRCKPEQLSLHATQDRTPGWDSFAFVELVMETELALQIAFSADDLSRIYTLGDLVRISAQTPSVKA
jgi:acyl-coenzyme A synthetase/AMP-(fatty) acid ligase/acyl carrier protein